VVATVPLPDGCTLRRARPDDAGLLSAIKIACWRDSYAGYLPQDLLDDLERHPDHSVAAWRAVLEADPPARVTQIVMIAGEDAGLVRCGPYDGSLPGWRGMIDALYLLAPFRGRGLGTALIGQARARLAAAGLAPVAVEAFTFNNRALALYRRLGAVTIGRAVAFKHAGRPIEETVLGWRDPAEGV
jgi:ribosomal protein S18 acetylase RimI-like enzyme